MNEQQLQTLIQAGESRTVEFKSDSAALPAGRRVNDTTIYEEVVAMANTRGRDVAHRRRG